LSGGLIVLFLNIFFAECSDSLLLLFLMAIDLALFVCEGHQHLLDELPAVLYPQHVPGGWGTRHAHSTTPQPAVLFIFIAY
jgi:hypothetical protein